MVEVKLLEILKFDVKKSTNESLKLLEKMKRWHMKYDTRQFCAHKGPKSPVIK